LKNSLIFDANLSQEELRGFSRTVAEIEWLTVILVLLYLAVLAPGAESNVLLILGTLCFAVFVLGFHYLNFYKNESNWKIAVETWVMIGFITYVIYNSGRLESPLLNLYLLVVITTALTLDKLATCLQMGLIILCYVWLGDALGLETPVSRWAQILAQLAPVILVAYVTTMLSSDIRRALLHIKALSETDELTGVLNMRAFTIVADRLTRQAVRYQRPYSILMIDSDSLKAVNDKYGHEAGNRLLKLLVTTIQAQLRETDIVARFGGDEFVVLLPETATVGAEKLATRIRQRVESSGLTTRELPVTTTVSIGIGSYPEHGNDCKAVIESADKALYVSKSGGKNRVTVADSRTISLVAS
jgi:diguanylate cyclase (GGDEF)-like protein